MAPAYSKNFHQLFFFMLVVLLSTSNSCTVWTLYNISDSTEVDSCEHIGLEISKELSGCGIMSGENITIAKPPSDTEFIKFSVLDVDGNTIFSSFHAPTEPFNVVFPVIDPVYNSVALVFSDDSESIISKTYMQFTPLFSAVKYDGSIDIYKIIEENGNAPISCSFEGPSEAPETIQLRFSADGRFLFSSRSIIESVPGIMTVFDENPAETIETVIYDVVSCTEILRLPNSGGIETITSRTDPGSSNVDFIYSEFSNNSWVINLLTYNLRTMEKNFSVVSVPMVTFLSPPLLFYSNSSIFIAESSGRNSNFTEPGKIFFGPVENPSGIIECTSSEPSIPSGVIKIGNSLFINCSFETENIIYNNINQIDTNESTPSVFYEPAPISGRVIPFAVTRNSFGQLYPVHSFFTGSSNSVDWLIFNNDSFEILTKNIILPHLESNIVFSTPIDEENILIYQSMMFSSLPGGTILNKTSFETTLTAVPLNFAVYVKDNVLLISNEEGLFLDSFDAVKSNDAYNISLDPYFFVASQF